MRLILFFMLLLSTMLFSNNATTHLAQLHLETHEMQQICLNVTSDGKTVITRTYNWIDLWRASDLEHIRRIDNVNKGYGCDLSKDDRYYLVQDMKRVYLYDLQSKKHIKNFDIPDKRHNDSLMSASFSSDGKYINSFEHTQTKPGYSRPVLYRFNIQTTQRKEVKSFVKRSASSKLSRDKLYTYDQIQKKIFIYDIKNGKETEGDENDIKLWQDLRGWWDCSKTSPKTKICAVRGDIKYSLASGDLTRTELNTSSSATPKITYMHQRPLRDQYFYESKLKMPYLITKTTQQYFGWNLLKGEQIWSVRQKLTVSAEFDAVPSSGMYFFKDQNRAIIITGFTDNILDFNTKTGLFSYLPKDKNIVAYNNISLSQDNKVLSLTATQQKKPYPLKTHYFEVDTWKKLPNYDPSDFKVARSEHPTRYIASYNNTNFILFRKKDNAKLATFHHFVNGEWLVMTPQGYFNASSWNVAVNILKMQHKKVNIETVNQLVKKCYRPDIVEALLSEQNIEELKQKNNTFTIPLKPKDNNQFKNSLLKQITTQQRYDLLKFFKRNRSRKDMALFFEGIETAKTSEAYSAYYSILSNYPFKRTKKFIESRIAELQNHPLEMTALLTYLYTKTRMNKRHKKVRIQYALQIINENNLSDDALLLVAKKMPYKDREMHLDLFWKSLEKLHYLREDVLELLTKQDPKRAKKAMKTYRTFKIAEARINILKTYEALSQTEQFTKERGTLNTEMKEAFQTLNDLNVSVDLSSEKKIAMKRLQAYLDASKSAPSTPKVYIDFLMKYASDTKKKILHTKIEIFTLQYMTDKNKKSYPIMNVFKAYLPYHPDFAIESMITLSKSPQRAVRSSVLYNMDGNHIIGIGVKSKKFVPILLKNLASDDAMLRDNALSSLLQYDDSVISQTITELNKLDNCSKIRYLDLRNSVIAKKVSKEEFKRYKCGNLYK